jgi:hypothetical protein
MYPNENQINEVGDINVVSVVIVTGSTEDARRKCSRIGGCHRPVSFLWRLPSRGGREQAVEKIETKAGGDCPAVEALRAHEWVAGQIIR